MLAGLLLVLTLVARLQQPETHRAIGRALGEPEPPAAAAPPQEQPRLVPLEAFRDAHDNAPFRAAEQPVWFETLEAVGRADAAALAAQSRGVVGYAALSSQPDTYRGRVVNVVGAVRRVERVEPAENDRGIASLWRVTVEPAGGQVWPITVYTLEEPPPANEPYDATAVGVFYKKLSYRWADGVGSTPVVVARRMETTLAPANDAPAAAPSAQSTPDVAFDRPDGGSLGRALLEELGYDIGSLDTVVDKRPLRAQESEAFYQLLRVLKQTPATQLVRLARAGLDDYVERRQAELGAAGRDRQVSRALEAERRLGRYSVFPLFGDGADERGELVTIDAVVRRAVRVDASGSAAASAGGVDHYYELEAFPEDSQNLPIVFVVRELPAGFPVGDAIRQPARLAGFFFKQWAYRSRQRAESSPAQDRRQFAPLLIGRAPIPLATPDASASRPGLAIGLLATVGLAAAAASLWRLGRRDRQYEAATLARYRRTDAIDPDRLRELAE